MIGSDNQSFNNRPPLTGKHLLVAFYDIGGRMISQNIIEAGTLQIYWETMRDQFEARSYKILKEF